MVGNTIKVKTMSEIKILIRNIWPFCQSKFLQIILGFIAFFSWAEAKKMGAILIPDSSMDESMKKYKTPNGKIATIDELIGHYGEEEKNGKIFKNTVYSIWC